METAVLQPTAIPLPPSMPGLIAPASAVRPQPVVRRKRKALPAVWMRAGTSKGLYLHRQDLPPSTSDWARIITKVMGSHDGDARQLNGVGGATSTTSKVAVVSPSQRLGVDVDYTFVQVPLGGSSLDMTGNCGNIASGVGPFAVDEGLVMPQPGQSEVKIRVFNTNTDSVMEETVQLDDDGHFAEDGDCALPGLFSTGSRVQMGFVKPAGTLTGTLLPTRRAKDIILVEEAPSAAPIAVEVSMVDAANPFVIVNGHSLPPSYHDQGPGAPGSIALAETIRRQAAVAMGLARTVQDAARTRGTPKIAIVSEPDQQEGGVAPDLQCVAYSMGKVHGSLQLTGAVCLSTAACTEGTVVHEIRSRTRSNTIAKIQGIPSIEAVRLRHPGGDMEIDVHMSESSKVERAVVSRTARRLFEGQVFYLE